MPNATPIHQVLSQSQPLTLLHKRLQEMRGRFEAVLPVVPAILHPHLSPGGIDDQGWTLLAANTSVAAKVRQMVPELLKAVLKQGWTDIPIRIKVAKQQ